MPDFDRSTKDQIKTVSEIILDNYIHAADYIVTVREPIIDMVHGSTVFVKPLTKNQFSEIKQLVTSLAGKVTTDNYRWGGKTRVISLDEINETNAKFSGGYEHIINDLIDTKVIPDIKTRIIRSINLVSIERINASYQHTTYKSFEDMGFEYK
jgi:hypothetical protein